MQQIKYIHEQALLFIFTIQLIWLVRSFVRSLARFFSFLFIIIIIILIFYFDFSIVSLLVIIIIIIIDEWEPRCLSFVYRCIGKRKRRKLITTTITISTIRAFIFFLSLREIDVVAVVEGVVVVIFYIFN